MAGAPPRPAHWSSTRPRALASPSPRISASTSRAASLTTSANSRKRSAASTPARSWSSRASSNAALVLHLPRRLVAGGERAGGGADPHRRDLAAHRGGGGCRRRPDAMDGRGRGRRRRPSAGEARRRMKPVSAELLALLATRQFFAADLYTFSGGNLGSSVLRYCAGDADLSANGFSYPAGGQIGPYFDRRDNKAKCHWKIGVEVDTLVVDLIPGSAKVFGTPFLEAVHSGVFDGAELTLDRAYMPTYGDTSRGLVRYFVGRVADVDLGRSICTFSVNSH